MLPPRRLLLVLLPALMMAASLLAPATAAAPEKLRLRELDRGPAPEVPFIADGTLVDGDVRIDLPRSLRQARLMGKSGADYLVQSYSPRRREEVVVRVAPDGSRTTLVSVLSLSDATLADDGASFVASKAEASPERTVLRRWDAATGALTQREVVPQFATVLDYDGSTAVIAGLNVVGTSLWDLATDEVTQITKQPGYEADLATDRLARFNNDPYGGGCTVVTSLSQPDRTLWRSCEERVDAFSTDGSRMATIDILTDGLGPGRFALRKTGGRVLGKYDAPYYFGRIRFENATDVLADTYARNAGAVVRCDAGGCERATRIFDHEAPLREPAQR